MPDNKAPEVKEEPRADTQKEALAKLAEEKRKEAVKKRRHKRIIKWSILSVVFLLLAAGLTFGVIKLFFTKEVIPDQTAVSYTGPFSSTISGYGVVKANATEAVTVKARGKLLEMFVKEGQTVAMGDPLYRVDDSTVKEAVVKAQEGLAGVQEDLDAIYKKIAALDVYAPFAGKLMDVKIKKGDVVEEGTELATLVDDSKMKLKLYFSYGYDKEIKVGQTARVSIPSSMSVVNGKVGNIEKVRKITAEGTVLFSVEIVLDNPGALASGMEATAELTAPDGGKVTPSESGKLEYYRSEKITSGAAGKVIDFNMVEFFEYASGDPLCKMEGISYDDQITSFKEQLASKQKELKDLNEQLAAFNAVAPIGGTVMSVAATEGQMIEAGATVLTISDTSSMTAEVQIDERNINAIKEGMQATLQQDTANGSKTYNGTVKSVSREGKNDYGYAYYPAIITIEGGEGLFSGSSINFNIVASSKDNCLLLPIQAVKYTESGTCVFVKADEKPDNAIDLAEGIVPAGYFAVPVETGMGDASVIEITKGIGEGVEVFLQPGVSQQDQGNMGRMYG